MAPLLFHIYISDIREDLTAHTLVYVDDSKVKPGVKSESDVERRRIIIINIMVINQTNTIRTHVVSLSSSYKRLLSRVPPFRPVSTLLPLRCLSHLCQAPQPTPKVDLVAPIM